MFESESTSPPATSAEALAAQWLARRDRGLSASEQAAYSQWLREDHRHEAIITRLEKVWSGLDRLSVRRPASGSPPNPDLLALPRRRSLWVWSPLLAAAAAVALVYFARSPGSEPRVVDSPPSAPNGIRQAIVHPGPERLTLEDGSIVELNAQAKVDVQFTPTERRVRLVRGEAYFTVAKNPNRPFIVSANQVAVRAVGTAFSVGIGRREISVLVTEGRVRVQEFLIPSGDNFPAPFELSALTAGQQGVVTPDATTGPAARPEMKVTALTPAEVDRALAWQGVRLEFVAMSLGDVVTEFNRYSHKKLVVGDRATAAILVGGTFRADNVDAFVRLLEVSFGVSAFPQGDQIVLRKLHGP